MKIILVEEKDIKVLMEQLELKKYELINRKKSATPVEDVYRAFHFIVCSWVQEQGSSYPNK